MRNLKLTEQMIIAGGDLATDITGVAAGLHLAGMGAGLVRYPLMRGFANVATAVGTATPLAASVSAAASVASLASFYVGYYAVYKGAEHLYNTYPGVQSAVDAKYNEYFG